MRKIVFGVMAAVLLIPAAAFAAPPQMATGGVGSTLGGTADIQFSFNAHAKDQKGHVVWENTVNGLWFKGTVDCYRQVGNTAIFSGTVDETGNPAFTHFIAKVVDNGEGQDNPDLFRVSPGGPRNCNTSQPPSDMWTAETGNLQVHQ